MDAQEFIDTVFNGAQQGDVSYGPVTIAANLALAFTVGLLIGFVYKKVHNGISYSQSYVFSIVLVTMIVAMAMMVIGSDITRAFALLGTFTIIRYRTAVKDPRDTAFIFIALVSGLAIGSSNHSIAFVGAGVICLAALVLDYFKFGAAVKTDKVLYVTTDTSAKDKSHVKEIIDKHSKSFKLINVTYRDSQDTIDYVYNINSTDSDVEEKMVKELTSAKHVKSVEVLAAQNIVEF